MNENSKISVLIVDDEPLGRTMLRRMLEFYPEAEIIGECGNGDEAVAAIEAQSPQIVFLDVQMPGTDGFAVIEKISEEKKFVVVFVTAYDEYAVRAFEAGALDYLLKPYDRKRFDRCFKRVVEQLRNKKSDLINEQILSLLSQNKSSEPFIERFIIKTGGRIFFLKAEEIIWIEAEGNYVMLHTQQKKHLFRQAISQLEQSLNPHKFRRISRSTVVNLDFVREMQAWFHGDYKILMQNGIELKLSYRYRDNLKKFFGGSL